MDNETALYILRGYPGNTTIRKIYDNEQVAEALHVLLPGLEYPDWDYRTVAAFLKQVTRKSRERLLT